MKAQLSPFLIKSKPAAKKLLQALLLHFPYVSILGTDTFGISYRVQRSSVSVEDSIWNERGFVVRVYNGVNYSEFSFNNFEEDKLEAITNEIISKLNSQNQQLKNLSVNSYAIIQEETIESSFCGEVKIHPSAVSSKEKLGRMQNMHHRAMNLSKELIDFRVIYTEVEISKIFISPKKDLEQAYIISEGTLFPLVRRGEKTKFERSSFSGLKAVELLDEMEEGIENVVKNAVELMDAEPVVPGEYDVICTPKITGLIVHEAFGHGVEMDMFVKNRAKAVEYLGKPVASQLITMHDGAAAAKDMSSYLFDDEGTLASDTVVIKDGILQTGISDILSAMKLGTIPTGNGKRQSFERKAYSRMTNTFFTPGESTFEEMLASIKHGYLLDGMMSGMEDPKNWGIQCLLIKALEIKDGAFTGKVVSPVILTGYVPDLLCSISMISKDFQLFGTGFCGKGHKEYVKVSDGGPYIKAKARLG